MSRAEHDDFFLDSLCLMWALCCLSDVMNITMAAVPFEICASHSICSCVETAGFKEEVSHVAFVVVSGLAFINREGTIGTEMTF